MKEQGDEHTPKEVQKSHIKGQALFEAMVRGQKRLLAHARENGLDQDTARYIEWLQGKWFKMEWTHLKQLQAFELFMSRNSPEDGERFFEAMTSQPDLPTM